MPHNSQLFVSFLERAFLVLLAVAPALLVTVSLQFGQEAGFPLAVYLSPLDAVGLLLADVPDISQLFASFLEHAFLVLLAVAPSILVTFSHFGPNGKIVVLSHATSTVSLPLSWTVPLVVLAVWTLDPELLSCVFLLPVVEPHGNAFHSEPILPVTFLL